jgi:hypothetical protein
MNVDRIEPDGRNEQFISTALEVETPAGYLGHVWPRDLQRHLFGDTEAELSPEVRNRRRSTLSVRWMVTLVKGPLQPRATPNVLPEHIDGNQLMENPLARPRAFEPSAVIAVYADSESRVVYELLDNPQYLLQRTSTLQLAGDRELKPTELAGLSALVVRGPPSAAARQAMERMLALGKPVREVGLELTDADKRNLASLVSELKPVANGSPAHQDAFTRLSSGEARIVRSDTGRARWVVLSEPWSIYGGWRAADGAGSALAIERADGVSSALFLDAGQPSFSANYAPESVRWGLWLYALGIVSALFMALWPERESRPLV